jgi:hypothetical protein
MVQYSCIVFDFCAAQLSDWNTNRVKIVRVRIGDHRKAVVLHLGIFCSLLFLIRCRRVEQFSAISERSFRLVDPFFLNSAHYPARAGDGMVAATCFSLPSSLVGIVATIYPTSEEGTDQDLLPSEGVVLVRNPIETQSRNIWHDILYKTPTGTMMGQ